MQHDINEFHKAAQTVFDFSVRNPDVFVSTRVEPFKLLQTANNIIGGATRLEKENAFLRRMVRKQRPEKKKLPLSKYRLRTAG